MAKYPIITADRNHFLKHSDIDSVNRANCPGPRFGLEGLIAQALQYAQNTNTPQYDSFLAMWENIIAGKVSVLDGWQ